MRQKMARFFIFLVTLFLLSVGVRMAEANGPPKTTELEAKLAKVEAGLKQIRSEVAQVEKGLSEMKEGLGKIEKKMVSDEKATPDNQKILNPFWLMIVIIIALVGMCVIAEILTRKPPNKRIRS